MTKTAKSRSGGSGSRRQRSQDAESTAVAAAPSPPGGRSRQRREQQRSIETRLAILEAALAEFAEKGFDAASTRNIGQRCGLHFSLIRYHFQSKSDLWQATATHFFGQITAGWEREAANSRDLDPLERIRREFRAFFKFTIEHPDFHQFMLHENRPESPRLPWLMDNLLAPLINRILPQIEAAQAGGDLPTANPVLLYYFLLGGTAALSSMGPEIRYNSGLKTSDPDVVEDYWRLIDKIVFKRRLYD